MKATHLKIHNFRSILNAEIKLSEYSFLVGCNNSGKSTVIDCIRAFYEKSFKYETSRDFPKQATEDNESWLEIEFELTQEEIESIKPEYILKNSSFRVRKYLESDVLDKEEKVTSGIYAYVNGELSDERFYGFKNVGQGKFGDLIYIPAVSKVDEHTKLTGPSALRDLISSVLGGVMRSSSAYKELQESFYRFEAIIKSEETLKGHSLNSIERDINSSISEWGTEFKLNVNPITADDLLKSLITHQIYDQTLEYPQPPSSYGQGFQRSLIYTLIRFAAKYSASTVVEKKKEFSPEFTWILFEEPEAFLHPSQIMSLNLDLQQLSKNAGTQILLTTHSVHFASHNVGNLTNLCRLHKAGHTSSAYQISEVTLKDILTSNNADMNTWISAGLKVDEDDLNSDMEALKYALWLDTKRSSAFFSEKVFLVEGPTETTLLGYLYDQGLLPGCRGVFFVDTLGKYNIHRFMRLFGALGIDHFVLFDRDNGRHQAIEKTINDTKSQFTLAVDYFPDDIEAFLGIPKAKKPHRKPQHLMSLLMKNSIPAQNLGSLISKIQAMVSI